MDSQTQVDVDPQASAQVDVGGIPDFVKLGEIPTDYVQEIQTDLLESVVQSDGSANRTGFCRFTLRNVGFLHSHSKLFVGLIPAAANSDAFLPPNVGIGSVVERAVLKVGNQVINEITDWAQLHAVKSAMISNEVNKEREMYTTGRSLNHGFNYNGVATGGGGAGSSQWDLADTYGLANGREYTALGSDLKQLQFAQMNGTSAAFIRASPVYSIDLSDLFPFLKTHQLPLYMIHQPVSIELTWAQPNQSRACIGIGDTANQTYAIDQTELKFAADYIFYGASDEMTRYADANKDLTFSFVDYRSNVATIDSTAAVTVVRNVGMANRMVTRIVNVFNRDALSDINILNKYSSLGPSVSGTGVIGDVAYNVRYNDRFEFPTNVTNTARLFSQLTDSESVPFVTKGEYAGNDDAITGLTYEGRAQRGELSNHFFYLGTRLTGGRVGSKGIEIHLTGTDFDTGAGPTSMRTYCEYLRIARLRDGNFEIFNA